MLFRLTFKFWVLSFTGRWTIIYYEHDHHSNEIYMIIRYAYSCVSPALRTAELTALTAVWMLVNSWVRSPVTDGTFFCSANTNRVSVMQFESNAGGSYCCCCSVIVMEGSKGITFLIGRRRSIFIYINTSKSTSFD